tara:strand:+ start:1033 stop:2331 length:1299 start_codon:yes stop_codon:yes gene_type:complete
MYAKNVLFVILVVCSIALTGCVWVNSPIPAGAANSFEKIETPVTLPSLEAGQDFSVLLPDGKPHTTANIRINDLIGDKSLQIFVTEPLAGKVTLLQGLKDITEFTEGLTQPVRVHAADIDGDSLRDILVADIGVLGPTNRKVGKVVLLHNRGDFKFEPITLLENVGRVACAEAGDFDSDGDLDIAVCVFGHLDGKLIWLEQIDDLKFKEHILDKRPGAIHAYPFDVDSDGDLDLAVALSQESEEVLLFRNDGNGVFSKEILFDAKVNYFGLSGIELADLDQDGDIDILYTNGDTLDFSEREIFPNNFYGVAWLENDGKGSFSNHELTRYWGAFAVKAIDLDRDSDIDLVLSGIQLTNLYPDAEKQSVIWLENDGEQNFERRTLEIELPPFMITLEAADIDNDGVAEIFGGSHNYTGGDEGHRLVIFKIPTDG